MLYVLTLLEIPIYVSVDKIMELDWTIQVPHCFFRWFVDVEELEGLICDLFILLFAYAKFV